LDRRFSVTIHYDLFNFCSHAVMGYASGIPTYHVRTDPVPTPCLKELVTQVTLPARPYDPAILIRAVPEISNDMQNWEALNTDAFGPLVAPSTQVKSQSKVGLFQRFDFRFDASGGGATGGLNVRIASIGRGEDPGGVASASYEEFIEYLDVVRRGFWAAPPPGAGRVLPFWPNDTAMTSDDGTGSWQLIYTPMFPTHEYRKLVVQLVVESFIGSALSSTLGIYPVASNTGFPGEFAELVPGFTTVTPGTTFPSVQTLEVSALGALTGFELAFKDTSGAGVKMAAKVSIMGLGIM
jgi:hypothetical protein